MRKIALEIPPADLIDINGDIFEIRRSDADILNECMGLQKKYETLINESENGKNADTQGINGNIGAIQAAVSETIALIDDILVPADRSIGESAVQVISKGRPVNIVTACYWFTAICREISKSNDDYIKAKYEQ